MNYHKCNEKFIAKNKGVNIWRVFSTSHVLFENIGDKSFKEYIESLILCHW